MRSSFRGCLLIGLALAPAACAEVLLLEDPGTHREALLAYLGSSLAPIEARDDRLGPAVRLERSPFLRDGGRRALDLDLLPGESAAVLRQAAEPAGAGWLLPFDALKERASDLHPRIREIPDELVKILQNRRIPGDPSVHTVSLESLIARGNRRIHFSIEEMLAPLASAAARPRHPPGTLLVGEEFDADGRVETHVMRKRADHEWDFALYDHEGRRQAQGRHGLAFRAPVTCFTCHQATGRVAPFADFPAPSREIRGFTPSVKMDLTAEERELHACGLEAEPEADQVHGKYRALALVELRRLTRDPAGPAWARDLRDRLVSRFPGLR